MSFLGGGGECSTGRNPLAQFTKHVSDDKSLQRDRLVGGRGGIPAGQEFRTQGPLPQGMTGDQQMDEFLMREGAPIGAAPGAFQFDGMRRELENMPGNASWAAEFAQMPPGEERARMEAAFHASKTGGPEFNPAEFAAFQQAQAQGPVEVQQQGPQPQQGGMGYYPQRFQGYPMGGGMYSGGFLHQQRHAPAAQELEVTTIKGKDKVVELTDEDWQNQFKEIEAQQHEPVADEDAAANKAIDQELNAHDEQLFGDFQSIWNGIQGENAANGTGLESEDWAKEYDLSKWEGMLPGEAPNVGDYMFEQENPYMEQGDPFSEGIRLMESGGNLSLAALAFEAACQKDPNHVQAWERLGAAQAQNEKETPAIRALETCLKLDPDNQSALMGLAVSYTNEGYDTTAYNTLERWLTARYPDLVKPTPPEDANAEPINPMDRHAVHSRVTDLFIRAAQLSPEGTGFDSDVQVGLGVLFYGAEEYDKAVDCFTSALESDFDARDKNHLLWNRLGATLANSGRSEEAIEAYERALTINPNFVRARYNLGVSCINIGCYEEAAQHLLGALSMHKVVTERDIAEAEKAGVDVSKITQNQSTNLFDTLRRVFGQMGRRDLADMVVNGMDVDVFRKEFEF